MQSKNWFIPFVCVCVSSYEILNSLNTNSIEREPQKLNLDILLFTG